MGKKKRRPEILKAGLKLLTPIEKKMMTTEIDRVQEMWKSLYARNKWTPQEAKK